MAAKFGFLLLVLVATISLKIVKRCYRESGELPPGLRFTRYLSVKMGMWIFLTMLFSQGCGWVGVYGVLRGKVVDSETGQPIPGANVVVLHGQTCMNPGGPNTYYYDPEETLTDEDGKFFFGPRLPFHAFLLPCKWEMVELWAIKPEYHIWPVDYVRTAFDTEHGSYPGYRWYTPYDNTLMLMSKIREDEYTKYDWAGLSPMYHHLDHGPVNASAAYAAEEKRVRAVKKRLDSTRSEK